MFVPKWIVLSLMVAAAAFAGWLVHDLAAEPLTTTPIVSAGTSPATQQTAATSTPPMSIGVQGGDSQPVINVTIDNSTHEIAPSPSAATTVSAGLPNRGGPVVYRNGSKASASPGSVSVVPVNHTTNNYDQSQRYDSSVKVNGNDVVVTSDGAIVQIGDNGTLHGNSGDASSSGSVGIDVDDSAVSTGDSGQRTVVQPAPSATSPAAQSATSSATGSPTADPSMASLASSTSATASSASARSSISSSSTTGPDATRASSTPSGSTADVSGQPSPGPSPPGGVPPPIDRMPEATLFLRDQASPPASFDDSTLGPAALGASIFGTASPSPLAAWRLGATMGRSVSISGYEDHSITVDGNDQIILYDDSNTFIDRDGLINANTGDTDSSGLNVVDARGSVVRSGNSGDGEGNDDEEEDEDEEGLFDPGDDGPAVFDPGDADEDAAQAAGGPLFLLEAADLDDDGPYQPPSSIVGSSRSSGSVGDEDTVTAANGDDSLVIGGDGYDDLAVRSRGNRNIVVYDDSNLVIGGVGDVNGQIGDSDTGGAVVMGVHDSVIEAGCEGDLCPTYSHPSTATAATGPTASSVGVRH